MAHCAECGKPTAERLRGLGAGSPKLFCDQACKTKFHAVMLKRGQVLAPLMLTASQHGGGEVASRARREAYNLSRIWNREDRTAGRRPELVVASKLASGWIAADAS